MNAIIDARSFAFDRAVERLTDLALLDIQQADLNTRLRYELHPLVRSFAGARLREKDREYEALQWLYADYFLMLAEKEKQPLWSPDRAAVCRLERELANLRIALDWYKERKEEAKIWRMIAALGWFWCVNDHLPFKRLRAISQPKTTASTRISISGQFGNDDLEWCQC